jgi:hypothetical protein
MSTSKDPDPIRHDGETMTEGDHKYTLAWSGLSPIQ